MTTLSEVRKAIDEAIEISGPETKIRIYRFTGDVLLGPISVLPSLYDEDSVEFE